MDRRTFLTTTAAAAVVSALPPMPSRPVMSIGVDLASGPDATVTRLMQVQRGILREIHRVTGIPRYQMGRDTWQDQVDAGLSEIIAKEGQSDGL